MLGDRLKVLRASRKLTQEELAEKIGVTRGTYAHYEINKRQPDYDTLVKIAKFFDVSTDYLISGHNNITISGQQINLSEEEYKIFEELKKHPILFHDLAKDPEKKIKELIRLQKARDMFLKEDDDEKKGNGFGELDDE
ncbi:helix-turn-helix transcriptional regulator [Niallia sp. FSL K6-0212]|uniref:helix-turn-helix domain-containing protein n=1 Tax=Niallia sp. FSL K6-0212 TaxID=2921423 RepID=UPI0030F65EAA